MAACVDVGRPVLGSWEQCRRRRQPTSSPHLLLRVKPDIARAPKEEEADVLRGLRASIGKDVTIKPAARLRHEQFDVMAGGGML